MSTLTTRLFIAANLLVSLTQTINLSAQAIAVANIGATIVIPMTLSRENDPEFQNASTGLKFSDDQIAPRIRTVHKNKIEVPDAGKVIEAIFTISGAPGYTYNLTMPKNFNLNIGNQQLNIDINARSASGNQILSQAGVAVVFIEGVLSTDNSKRVAYHSGESYDFAITMNDE